MSDWSPEYKQFAMCPQIVVKVLGDLKKIHLLPTYIGIASYYGPGKGKKLQQPYPSHKKIGERIGQSASAVRKSTKQLEKILDDRGIPLLEITHRQDKNNPKEKSSNVYTLPHYEYCYLKELYYRTPSTTVPNPPSTEGLPLRHSTDEYLNTLSKTNYPKYTTYIQDDDFSLQDLIKDLSNEKSM